MRGMDHMLVIRYQDYGVKAHPPSPPLYWEFLKAARALIQRTISQCPCSGVRPIWRDDPSGASSGWDIIVREYENLGGFV